MNILKNNAEHAYTAKLLNIKSPQKISNETVVYVEADYSSKVNLECSRNPQSNKLNHFSNCSMMTLRALFSDGGVTQTIGCHIFQDVKDSYSAWNTGRDLILEKLQERGLKFKHLVKVSL